MKYCKHCPTPGDCLHRNVCIAKERTGGAASTSGGLLPEPRSGVGQSDPLTSSDDAPLPDQGKGELRRLRDEITRRADSARAMSERRKRAGLFDSSHYYLGEAAAFDSIARMLAARLRESRPQSDSEEVEECPSCSDVSVFIRPDGERLCGCCHHQWARGKRTERSGSGNGAALDPVGDGKSEP